MKQCNELVPASYGGQRLDLRVHHIELIGAPQPPPPAAPFVAAAANAVALVRRHRRGAESAAIFPYNATPFQPVAAASQLSRR